MNTHTSIATLRQHLENLFPGKWIHADHRQKTLLTGLPEIDHSLTRGLARQRITEWAGPVSSGKTSVLRAIINNWCVSGFDVAYVDTENRLIASDWIFIEQGRCKTKPTSMSNHHVSAQSPTGKFWVIRDLSQNRRSGSGLARQSNLWATDELIRSNAFDVVVLDLGSSERTKPISSRIYARLQNSLARSKTALILLRDSEFLPPGWGCYAQIGFHWGSTVNSLEGLQGAVMILPSIHCSVTKDGLSHKAEVQVSSHVANRLFAHSQVPDRRTSKT
jgi:hypothetical protein